MAEIDLLKYADRIDIIRKNNQSFVKDVIRKKDILLLPEELVRQCTLHFLLEEVKVSKNLIRVEKGIKVNGLFRRCDIIVYDRNALPLLIVECKKPSLKLTQKVFNQIAMYNIPLQVPYLMVTNGKHSHFCNIEIKNGQYSFMEMLPSFTEMLRKK